MTHRELSIPPSRTAKDDKLDTCSAELSDTVLPAIVGGLNPQPLPPRVRPPTRVLTTHTGNAI